MNFTATSELGQVFVQTTDHRGHTVEEIAEAILWIMGNGFATGTVLEVDGGYKLT